MGFLQPICRLHPDHIHSSNRSRLLGSLIESVKDYFQERNSHREEHPDVNHLYVGGYWQALEKPKETEMTKLFRGLLIKLTWLPGLEGL